MSNPYYIHKDDLEMYQKWRAETKVLRDEEHALLSQLDPADRKKFNEEWSKISKNLDPKYEALAKKYPVRSLSLFDEKTSKKNYVVHFLGHRVDNDPILGKLVDVAKDGMEKCKKAIRGK